MFSVPWRIAAIALAALAPLWGTAPPADAATSPVRATRLPNCNYNGGVAPCFEPIWANGIQVKMIFDNLNPEPSNAPTRNFYVTAVQTRTPQGLVSFLHDHVIGQDRPQTRADNRENDSIRYHGFFVLCSAEGISGGGCVPTMTSIAGLGTIPLAKTIDGMKLTSAAPIESQGNSALITLFDTGGVFIATINREHASGTR